MHDGGRFFLGDAGQGLASMKPGTPLLQFQGLAGEDFLQLVGAGNRAQESAVIRDGAIAVATKMATVTNIGCVQRWRK